MLDAEGLPFVPLHFCDRRLRRELDPLLSYILLNPQDMTLFGNAIGMTFISGAEVHRRRVVADALVEEEPWAPVLHICCPGTRGAEGRGYL